jgi:peptidoglycan/xylan/chitin deacetylase (PgdA/CDA1 family)
VLTEWSAAGLPLGNHGWSHKHLSEMSIAEFEQELVKNEPLLRHHSKDGDWRWFRYPFLDEGEDAAKRASARQVLGRHGYRIAGVTMDFGDWQWTAPYARCAAAGDAAAIHRLESSFLDAARQSIGFYRTLSRQLYGRDIPYVIVLHMSAFEARMLPRLLDLYRDQGFRFVPLEQAQSDPAFADDMNPSMPASPRGLEGKANARSIPLPPRTDYAPMLEAICR